MQENKETKGNDLWLIAKHLKRYVRPDLNLLQDISLVFKPNELVVIVGQSGSGKSTLLNALAGYKPASDGEVFVNQYSVYEHFDAVRSLIGYVPQKDIIHMELTVFEALDYAAQLRLPRGTSKKDRRQRVMEVLHDLDLEHRKDVRISGLSGGQQKRVSIGVELLTRPDLFFLDEPTSGLDPGTETALMHLLRRLANQGRTVVLITHATKNVMLADKVIFLARGGYLSWFGPPDEALQFFGQYRDPKEQHLKEMEFDDIYAMLDDSGKGSPEEWAERYLKHPAYQKHVLQYLQQDFNRSEEKTGIKERLQTMRNQFFARVGPFQQFLILSARNLRILLHDRSSLMLMLLAPILVSGLDFLIANLVGKKVFDYHEGVPFAAVMSLFLLSLYALMVAALSQMREFVKEQDIYKRERLVNLRVLPYVTSKIWLAILLAFYHGVVYTLLHNLAFEMPGGALEFRLMLITLFLASLAGMMLGLLASALAPNSGSAPMLTILLIIPNIVLSNALVTLPTSVSAPASTFWTFRSLIGITGLGADIAANDCWQFPDELRMGLTLEDKNYFNCRCMGTNLFDQDSCNFPAIGQAKIPEMSQDPPQKPADLPQAPAEPEIPPPPAAPEDQFDKVAIAAYLNEIQLYQEQVNLLQADFRNQMDAYQLAAGVYQAQMAAYQNEYSRWYVARSAAVGAVEGNIRIFLERFDWAFVNKEDPAVFQAEIRKTFYAQGTISGVIFLLVLVLIKRKDHQL